ncbi:serine hydrolase [Nocardia cyriacigeorgica]|uniref:serine hydrolase n=1 Tax=Nocardia cyriacigeorgica TaxID=135487 RepID=UPI001895CDB1|nr:serine hydrolase [Nocardia cyriacigeorgica]MBF6288972.1 serine hydrolase [Nocardia cyriacigeorgica]
MSRARYPALPLGTDTGEITDRIRAVFADAGCTGWLHARRCGSPAEISVDAHDRVVIASVYKLVLLVAFCRRVDAGLIDPRAPLTVYPADCTPGPTGIAALHDPVTMSRRDLATSMMTVSDNAAADVLLGEIGLGAVEELLTELGLTETRIVGGTADVHRSLVRDTDTHSTAEAFAALADNDEAWSVSAYDPSYASATTPEEMTRFLDLIWAGGVLSPEQTGFVRAVMGKQVWPHRIASAFPHRGVGVAGKTGTIGVIRNEVAVVEFPDEYPVAVAVFTRAARADPQLAVVDAAIAEAARIAVTALRHPLTQD